MTPRKKQVSLSHRNKLTLCLFYTVFLCRLTGGVLFLFHLTMIPLMSLMTAVKDYVQMVNHVTPAVPIYTYWDGGAILTFIVLSFKHLVEDLLTFRWLTQLGGLPQLVPDLTERLVNEHNLFADYANPNVSVLDSPMNQAGISLVFEKAIIGVLNSVFLCFPTVVSHVIILRRFVMQGVESGRAAALGTIAGNITWISCVIFGCRFLLIPWLSMDLLRYGLGLSLLLGYIYHSCRSESTGKALGEGFKERSLFSYAMLNFLLAWTEQTTVYPFLSHLSFNAGVSAMEGFAVDNWWGFMMVHGAYILGLLVGSVSLMLAVQWFWENPFYKFYKWMNDQRKVATGGDTWRNQAFSYVLSRKFVSDATLYFIMVMAMGGILYHAMDYVVLNPLGFAHPDRIMYDYTGAKRQREADKGRLLALGVPRGVGWLSAEPDSQNMRRKIPSRAGWTDVKRWHTYSNYNRYLNLQLYDNGRYNNLSQEDLDAGFNVIWLRRGEARPKPQYNVFPVKKMREFKISISKKRVEELYGLRTEFFQRLREEKFARGIHTPRAKRGDKTMSNRTFYWPQVMANRYRFSADRSTFLRKFARKTALRFKAHLLDQEDARSSLVALMLPINPITYSVTQKVHMLEKDGLTKLPNEDHAQSEALKVWKNYSGEGQRGLTSFSLRQRIYQDLRKEKNNLTFSQPIDLYLQRERALERKWSYYSGKVKRHYGSAGSTTFLRVLLNKVFIYPRHNKRRYMTNLEASTKAVRQRPKRIRRAESRVPLFWSPEDKQFDQLPLIDPKRNEQRNQLPSIGAEFVTSGNNISRLTKPSDSYRANSVTGDRYRQAMFKHTLEHWYYQRPLRQFLMAWDIDNFIRRQPRSHWLSPAEEKLLHLRRSLLMEHYNGLRWYRTMEQYGSMKRATGGIKTAANGLYQQQFQGTLRKIRHLFALTPTQSDRRWLSFDQPLYNEYSNTRLVPANQQSWWHEELEEQGGTVGELQKSFDSIRRMPSNEVQKMLENGTEVPGALRQSVTQTMNSSPKIEKFEMDENIVTPAPLTMSYYLRRKKLNGDGFYTGQTTRMLKQASLWLKGRGDRKSPKPLINTGLLKAYLDALSSEYGVSKDELQEARTMILNLSDKMSDPRRPGGEVSTNFSGKLLGAGLIPEWFRSRPKGAFDKKSIQNWEKLDRTRKSMVAPNGYLQMGPKRNPRDSRNEVEIALDLQDREYKDSDDEGLYVQNKNQSYYSGSSTLPKEYQGKKRDYSNLPVKGEDLSMFFAEQDKEKARKELATYRLAAKMLYISRKTGIPVDRLMELWQFEKYLKTDQKGKPKKPKAQVEVKTKLDWFSKSLQSSGGRSQPITYYTEHERFVGVPKMIRTNGNREPARTSPFPVKEDIADQLQLDKARKRLDALMSLSGTPSARPEGEAKMLEDMVLDARYNSWPLSEIPILEELDPENREFGFLTSYSGTERLLKWYKSTAKMEAAELASILDQEDYLRKQGARLQLNQKQREETHGVREQQKGRSVVETFKQDLQAVPQGNRNIRPYVLGLGLSKKYRETPSGALEPVQENLMMEPVPLYAGWDEAMRKFVVTPQISTRTQMAVDMIMNASESVRQKDQPGWLWPRFPLRGMSGRSVRSEIENFNLPMVTIGYMTKEPASLAFTPLGWRRFKLRHSLIQNWMRSRMDRTPEPMLRTIDPTPLKKSRSELGNELINRFKRLAYSQEARVKAEQEIVAGGFFEKNPDAYMFTPKDVSLVDLPRGPRITEVLPNQILWALNPNYNRAPELFNVNFEKLIKKRPSMDQEEARDFTWRRLPLPKRGLHRKTPKNSSDRYFRRKAYPTRRRLIETTGTAAGESQTTWRPAGGPLYERSQVVGKNNLTTGKDYQTTTSGERRVRRVKSAMNRTDRTWPYNRYRIIPLPGGFMWPGEYSGLYRVDPDDNETHRDTLLETPQVLDIRSKKLVTFLPDKKEAGQQNPQIRIEDTFAAKIKANQVLPYTITKNSAIEHHNLEVLKRRLQKTGSPSTFYERVWDRN